MPSANVFFGFGSERNATSRHAAVIGRGAGHVATPSPTSSVAVPGSTARTTVSAGSSAPSTSSGFGSGYANACVSVRSASISRPPRCTPLTAPFCVSTATMRELLMKFTPEETAVLCIESTMRCQPSSTYRTPPRNATRICASTGAAAEIPA
jgi:hypothetical protein